VFALEYIKINISCWNVSNLTYFYGVKFSIPSIVIDDLQAQNRALEEKNKCLEEKCQRLTNTGKELHHHLSKLVKAYQALEKKLNDESAEKGAYINVSFTLTTWYKHFHIRDTNTWLQ